MALEEVGGLSLAKAPPQYLLALVLSRGYE